MTGRTLAAAAFLIAALVPGAVFSQDYLLRPLWTAGADGSGDVVFGRIEDVHIAPGDTVYVLDSQLCVIRVFGPDGIPVRSLGREGDGPGEFRSPGFLAGMPDGSLGVVSRQSGRIIKLDPCTGAPRGCLRPAGIETGLVQVGRIHALPRTGETGAVVAVIREPVVKSSTDLVYGLWSYLAEFPDLGVPDPIPPTRRLLDVGEVAGADVEEENYFSLWDPWTVDARGRIVAAPFWDRYHLRWFTPDGRFACRAEFEFPGRKREEFEKRRFLDYLWGGVSPARFGVELVASETEAVVRSIYPRSDGSLWVRTNRAGLHRHEGVFLALEAVTPDGRAAGTVRILGPGDESIDRVFFGSDDFMVIVHGAERFIRNAPGSAHPSAPDAALTVSAYRLDPVKFVAGGAAK
ncbi:MAG: hypothetical protein AB7V45_02550 [Candidatus Krumholzibacteriia bacterium]